MTSTNSKSFLLSTRLHRKFLIIPVSEPGEPGELVEQEWLTEHWFVGINDKTLAEFVIVLHGKSKTLDDFKAKLKENGADFPDSFVENLDRLILALHPKYKKKAKANTKAKKMGRDDAIIKDHQARMFPGLALPDQEWKSSPLGEKDETVTNNDATEKEVDGLMSQLEGFAKKSRPRAADMMDMDGPATKRRRTDSSPPRRRSRSPQMALGGPRDRGRGRDDWDGERRRPQFDERPVLYKIYDGKVSGLRDFGAFVTLEGVRGRVEGASLLTLQDLNLTQT